MNKHISDLLKKYNIILENREQVFFAAEMESESLSFSKTMLGLILLVLVIVGIFFFLSELAIIGFIFLCPFILWMFTSADEEEEKQVLETPITSFLVLTSNRIISKKETFAWSQIHKVVPIEYLGNQCIILQFYPEELDSEARIADRNFIIEPDFIFVNSRKKSNTLFDKIDKNWETQQPANKLQELGTQLIESFNLTELPIQQNIRSFEGNFKELLVRCTFKNKFPFKEFKAEISLQNAIPAYFKMLKHPKAEKLKLRSGKKQINIDYFPIDDHYQIEGSHPNDIKILFNDSVKESINHLKTAGNCDWQFGEPGEKQKILPTKIKDSEDVLDLQLLEESIENNPQWKSNHNPGKSLTFQLDVHRPFQNDVDSIKDIIEISMELSIQFAEGISKFQND